MNRHWKRALSLVLILSVMAMNLAIPAMAAESITVSHADLPSTLTGGQGTLFFETSPNGVETPQTNYNRAYSPLEVWSNAARASLNMKGTEWIRYEVEVTTAGFYAVDLTYGCGVAAGVDFVIRTVSTIVETHLPKSGQNAYSFTTAEGLGYVYLAEGTNYIYVDNKSTAQVNFKSLDLTFSESADATQVKWLAPVESANEIADLTISYADGYNQAEVSTVTLPVNLPVDGKYKVSVMGIATETGNVSADFGADAKNATVANDAYGYSEIGVFALTEGEYTLTLNGFSGYSFAWAKIEYAGPYGTDLVSESFTDGNTVARGTDNLTITFNDTMMASAEATLTADGTEIPVTVDVDGTKVIVSFLETLAYETDYLLEVTGLQGIYDAEALNDRTYIFSTGDDSSDEGTDAVAVTEVESYHEAVTIKGTALGSTGYGIKGRTVTVTSPEGDEVATAISGDDGAFTIEFTIADGIETGEYCYTVTTEYGATASAVVNYISEVWELRILGLFLDASTPADVYVIFDNYGEQLLISDIEADCATLANEDLFLAHFQQKQFGTIEEVASFYRKMLLLEQMNQATTGSSIVSDFLEKPDVCELIGIASNELSLVNTSAMKIEFAGIIVSDTIANGPSTSEEAFLARIEGLLTAYLNEYYGMGDVSLVGDSYFQDLPIVCGGSPIVIPIVFDREKTEVSQLTLTVTASDPTIFSNFYYTPNEYFEQYLYDGSNGIYDDGWKDIYWLDEFGNSYTYDANGTQIPVQPVKKNLSVKGKSATITIPYYGGKSSYFGAFIIEPVSVKEYQLTIFGEVTQQVGEFYQETAKIIPSEMIVDTTFEYGLYYDSYCEIEWILTPDGVLTIMGSGTLGYVGDDLSGRQSDISYERYKNRIRKVEICDGITGIGNYAFSSYPMLEEVVVPDNLYGIGSMSFGNCSNLKTLSLPDSVTSIGPYAFESCSSLKEFHMPEKLRTIGAYAFLNCASLEELKIPETASEIGQGAFYGCTGFRRATVGEWLNGYSLYQGVGLFDGCSALESVVIEDGVKEIHAGMFYQCSSLKEITIPDTVTVIGNSAFMDCSALETIEIPDSVTSVGLQAFAGCSSLTELPLMKDATDIGYCAFLGCSSIRELIIPDSVTTVGTGAFSLCTGIETIRWSKNLTLVPSLAFNNCDGLVHLELPDHVDAIGYCAFADCDNLTTISLTTNTTVIGEGAFKDCNALTDVFYSGTKAEWDEVFIGDDNDALLNATIHFVTRLVYDANGGENAPKTVNTEGEVEISTQIPTRFGYLFKGWGTTQNSSMATYQPGETIVLPDGGMTLYAVWYPIEMGARIYDDGLLVSVYNAPVGSQIVAACYLGDTLVYVDGVITTDEQRYHIPGDFTQYDQVKVMLYDGFSTLKPLILPVDVIDSSN